MTKRSVTYFQDVIAQTKQSLVDGGLTAEQRAEAEAFCRDTANISAQDLATYNFFFEHMPKMMMTLL